MPLVILCDNECFLTAPASRAAHAKARVKLFHVPARSPDLNPVEMFWSWLRKRLRAMDLDDLRAGRPALAKVSLKLRVRTLIRKPQAMKTATNIFKKLRTKCAECVHKKGCPPSEVDALV